MLDVVETTPHLMGLPLRLTIMSPRTRRPCFHEKDEFNYAQDTN